MIAPGQKLKIEKIDAGEGGDFIFDEVLLAGDEKSLQIGMPALAGIKVEARVLKQGRAKKIIVFKYHNKTRYRKKQGHRQPFTEVEIRGITS